MTQYGSPSLVCLLFQALILRHRCRNLLNHTSDESHRIP